MSFDEVLVYLFALHFFAISPGKRFCASATLNGGNGAEQFGGCRLAQAIFHRARRYALEDNTLFRASCKFIDPVASTKLQALMRSHHGSFEGRCGRIDEVSGPDAVGSTKLKNLLSKGASFCD